MDSVNDPSRARLSFHAVGGPKNVVFEPFGDTFSIEPGRDIYLDLPIADVSLLEVLVFENAISVTLRFSGDTFVLDQNGELLQHLGQIG